MPGKNRHPTASHRILSKDSVHRDGVLGIYHDVWYFPLRAWMQLGNCTPQVGAQTMYVAALFHFGVYQKETLFPSEVEGQQRRKPHVEGGRMNGSRPRFLSAYALHPQTGEVLEPPALQEGFMLLPYSLEGWLAGYKWALVPIGMSAQEAGNFFDGGEAQKLTGIGWDLFDPAGDQSADWDLQQVKALLSRRVGKPARWVLNGETGIFREVVSNLLEVGFVVDHIHACYREGGRPRYLVVRDGNILTKSGEDVSAMSLAGYGRVVADERHPR